MAKGGRCAAGGIAISLFTLVMAAGAAAQPTTLTDLGALAGDTRAFAVSGDGSAVVGESGGQAFVWSADTGMIGLGGLRATCVSRYGGTIGGYTGAGSGSGQRSVRWTAWNAGSLEDLNTFGDGSFSSVNGVSGDGTVLVGNAYNGSISQPDTVAYRWTSLGGAVSLSANFSSGVLYGSLGASADGSIVVGNRGVGGPAAFRWVSGVTSGVIGAQSSSAQAVTPDGAVVVGWYKTSGSGPVVGFRWQAGSPAITVDIPDLPGGAVLAHPLALSADGSLVVGEGNTDLGSEAFIWDATNGTRNLRDVLIAEGVVDATNWYLESATGISADGTVIVGYGVNPVGQIRGWRVRRGCYVNCDGSTMEPVLNVADFSCFLVRFASGDPYANCDGSTTAPLLSVQDFTCFLQRFSAGCS